MCPLDPPASFTLQAITPPDRSTVPRPKVPQSDLAHLDFATRRSIVLSCVTRARGQFQTFP